MPRNDSILGSGLSSVTSRRLAEASKKKTNSKKDVVARLKPEAELIFAEIKQARTELASEIANIIHMDMSKTDVKSVVLGLRLADTKLVNLENRLRVKLTRRTKDEQ
jgi:hypothetical protein